MTVDIGKVVRASDAAHLVGETNVGPLLARQHARHERQHQVEPAQEVLELTAITDFLLERGVKNGVRSDRQAWLR